MSGSGINWAVCKSAPCSRQITTPAPHRSVFYRPDALPAAQPTVSKHWRQKCNYNIIISWPTFTLLFVALCLQWNNVPYSTVDGRRLVVVTNTLCVLVLSGVHCQRICNEYRQALSEFSELPNTVEWTLLSLSKHYAALTAAKYTIFQSLCISNVRINIKINFCISRTFQPPLPCCLMNWHTDLCSDR